MTPIKLMMLGAAAVALIGAAPASQAMAQA